MGVGGKGGWGRRRAERMGKGKRGRGVQGMRRVCCMCVSGCGKRECCCCMCCVEDGEGWVEKGAVAGHPPECDADKFTAIPNGTFLGRDVCVLCAPPSCPRAPRDPQPSASRTTSSCAAQQRRTHCIKRYIFAFAPVTTSGTGLGHMNFLHPSPRKEYGARLCQQCVRVKGA